MSKMPSEQLWEIYSVKAEWPEAKQVEQLVRLWNLKAEQISTIMGLSIKRVQTYIIEIEKEWRELGKPMTDDDRLLARGRHIAELEQLKAQLDEVYAYSRDAKFLTQKAAIMEKLAKLRGLDQERASDKVPENAGMTLADRLAKLTASQAKELTNRLKQGSAVKETPVEDDPEDELYDDD